MLWMPITTPGNDPTTPALNGGSSTWAGQDSMHVTAADKDTRREAVVGSHSETEASRVKVYQR